MIGAKRIAANGHLEVGPACLVGRLRLGVAENATKATAANVANIHPSSHPSVPVPDVLPNATNIFTLLMCDIYSLQIGFRLNKFFFKRLCHSRVSDGTETDVEPPSQSWIIGHGFFITLIS